MIDIEEELSKIHRGSVVHSVTTFIIAQHPEIQLREKHNWTFGYMCKLAKRFPNEFIAWRTREKMGINDEA